jgi:hypothetical protein
VGGLMTRCSVVLTGRAITRSVPCLQGAAAVLADRPGDEAALVGRFFEELVKKLAERWLALLVSPGVLFLVVAVVGGWQGYRAALDWSRFRQGVDDFSTALRGCR